MCLRLAEFEFKLGTVDQARESRGDLIDRPHTWYEPRFRTSVNRFFAQCLLDLGQIILGPNPYALGSDSVLVTTSHA
jgi:hypothetical protein